MEARKLSNLAVCRSIPAAAHSKTLIGWGQLTTEKRHMKTGIGELSPYTPNTSSSRNLARLR